MIVLAVVLGVIALALGVLAIVTRSSLGAARHQIEALTERLDAVTAEAEKAAGEASAAAARADEQRARIVELELERDAADAKRRAAEDAVELVDEQVVESTERAITAERAAGRGLDALGVWALETLRLDRMWREQLSSSADTPSPFAATADPTRTAVQILVDAVRERSGTPVDVHWKIDAALPPGPGVRLVRTVEELLAFARPADHAELTVEPSGSRVIITLSTDPELDLPIHLSAVLEAAGLDVLDDEARAAEAGPDRDEAPLTGQAVAVPVPRDAPGWEAS